MNFKSPLDTNVQLRVEACDARLKDPKRLAAVARTGLMDTPPEVAFDRLAKIAAQILRVPLTIISLIGDKKQFFKASFGLPKSYETSREVPITDSICRYTLAGEEIIAADAATDSLLKFHPTTGPWGITAFLSIPMRSSDGHVLGSFCAIDTNVREWSTSEIELMRELTNSAMTEIHLRNRVAELDEERRLREQFVATLTHDLLNPIGVARGSAEILRRKGDDLEKRTQMITMIEQNMDRAEFMIRDLLNVTSVRVGQPLSINVAQNDLATLIHQTTSDLARLHGDRVEIDGPTVLICDFDANVLRRVIENLVGNAFKYGSKDKPILLKYRASQDEVELSVHNKGEPISAASIEKIFEPFSRSDSAMKSQQKGWGIGLSIVRAFVEAHGGSVRVESAKGGTTFFVTLPRITNFK